ncbi:MAG: putative PEP-binding protein, partial [Candidatus Promineifilaceae bacterium]
PGAATGRICFTPDEAEKRSQKEPVILIRHETSPDDFHGMLAAEAVLTARGGMTSHAAVVARGMGKPCVVGAGDLQIDEDEGFLHINGVALRRGKWLTIDGSTGRVIKGKVPTVQPKLNRYFRTLMEWADEARVLEVRANVDSGRDAKTAREFGAEGIGLCRTEHMFFEKERLDIMREMILAESRSAREEALERLLPIQKKDFKAIFHAMDGLPVTIRLLDPPLHEFLPDAAVLQTELVELKLKLQKVKSFKKIDATLKTIYEKEQLMTQVDRLHESNPMLGHRGCRLGMVYPEVTSMQARAIMAAACEAQAEGIVVKPEIMIPLVSISAELQTQRAVVKAVADSVIGEYGIQIDYQIGTMIELPRAAITADQIAKYADFFSFGTNDLTQTTYGLSRDDSTRFLSHYISNKVMPNDPFRVLDQEGVGQIVKMGIEKGRQTKPNLKVGICGEHGGEPTSIDFCHRIGMNYVSCSPFRVPIARLAAAQSALNAT